jgi:hypothetical protein
VLDQPLTDARTSGGDGQIAPEVVVIELASIAQR